MILTAAFLLAAAPASALAPAPQSPVELFKAACMGGSVSLPRGSAAPTTYDKLPRGAREALGQTLAVPGDERNLRGAPKAEDVPNQLVEVGPGSALFLIAPAADPAAKGAFAHSCAVVWKGEHFADARAVVVTDSSTTLAGTMPQLSPVGLASVGNHQGDLYLVATTLRGWTVLKAEPQTPAAPSGEH
ncbi:MAG TPA: hypothetical protein VH331_03325 [Allosphingosinicella sp.]|jgi:hypothetical protein|nr:hypothetical protein [Allosphingosinicella sp.]